MNIEQQYLELVEKILTKGDLKQNRTGQPALTIAGAMLSHDMEEGFPLLTTKKVPFKLVSSELEFFIKGLTDKKWLQDRGNHIWDDWASPKKAPYGHTPEAKQKMKDEMDLGPVYGSQWRNFNGQNVDQLKNVVDKLKSDPSDRRMIVSAWNPLALGDMALMPCHYAWQVTVINGRLNLAWNQRSCDVMIGIPFNIASYGLLLHLLSIESGLKPGRLIGFLMDTHIYNNHVNGAREQIQRKCYSLPSIVTNNEKFDIFNWEHTTTKICNYEYHPKIEFEIAV